MEYAREYLRKYLSADEETRKASKDHWVNVFTRELYSGKDYTLSASILAVISIAEEGKANGNDKR